MAESKLYEIDFGELDCVAQRLGFRGIDLLGLNPKSCSSFVKSGISTLTQLAEITPLKLIRVMEQSGMRAKTARRALEQLSKLCERPMGEHLAQLRERHELKDSRKVRKEPLLPQLARPFYEAVGHELTDEVTLEHLHEWREEYWVDFSGSNREVKKLPNDLPLSMAQFMAERKQVERLVIECAFWAAHRCGFEDVGSIRVASFADLLELGKGTATFCSVGFGHPAGEQVI